MIYSMEYKKLHASLTFLIGVDMKKYIIAARKQQYIVDAENEFRAIQAVIAATELYACDIDICHLFDSYPVKLQTRLLISSIIL